MAASTTLISLEEYSKTSYKPYRDFVEGELHERNVGEYAHSRSQTELIFYFRSRERIWNIRTMVEHRIRVTIEAAGTPLFVDLDEIFRELD